MSVTSDRTTESLSGIAGWVDDSPMPIPIRLPAFSTRIAVSAVVFAAGCGAVDATQSGVAQGQDVGPLQAVCAAEPPDVEVFEQDAQSYADAFGVSLEEAMERLALQNVDGLHEAGVAAARDLWAGGWMEHEPEFGYVFFYRGEPDDVDHVRAAAVDCSVPIIIRSGAEYSEIELLAGMERLTASGRLAPPMPDLSMSADVKTGAIVLGGPIGPGPDVLAEIEEIAGVPVRYVQHAAETTQ